MIRIALLCTLTSLKIFGQLNSPFDEQNPIITPDGKEMYITIASHPLNVSGKRDLGDIWVLQLQDGKWAVPKLPKGLINNGGYNAVLGFSADGNEMFLYGHYNANGSPSGSQGISVSKKSAVGWSIPKNETVPYFQNKSVATGGYITPDKTVFIFSADAQGSEGNEDIFVSINEGMHWTEPKNIGATVNTKYQELTPWLSIDTKTIYFSSNPETTLGSFDIYTSNRLDDSWVNWSQPENLGTAINSPGRDLYYHTFPDQIFFTSTYNSDGYGDIKSLPISKTESSTKPLISSIINEKTDTTSTKTTLTENAIHGPSKAGTIRIFGKIINSATGAGIKAEMIVHGETVISTSSSIDGNYEFTLNPKVLYSLRIESPGHIGLFEKLDLTKQDLVQIEINFKLQPVIIGVSINLKSVLFKQSSSELLAESFAELDMVVDFLKTNPTVEIELAGHTDNAGNAKLNLKLSRDRVARVKNYITERGIQIKRVRGVGFGGSKPIAANKTEEGKKLNRRVEFRILKV